MKSSKMYKDRELKGRKFNISGEEYYRGSHGEIRSRTPKPHLSKKRRRAIRQTAKEQAGVK